MDDCTRLSSPPITEQGELEDVRSHGDRLFSQFPALVVTAEEGSPLLTAAEFDVAVDRVHIKARKTPGPDGILNSVWTIVYRANPVILDAVFKLALKSGVFPPQWKVVQLVLLQKPGRQDFLAGHCRVAEEALLKKVCLERQLVSVSSWLLYDRHGLKAEKARCISNVEVPLQRSRQP